MNKHNDRWRTFTINIHKKGKGFPYSLPSLGPGADPGVQAVSPQVTWSHPPGGRLPLLFARPAVTFPAEKRHRPSAGTKLYCLVTEAHACEQLAQGYYLEADRPGFESVTFRITSERSPIKPSGHACTSGLVYNGTIRSHPACIWGFTAESKQASTVIPSCAFWRHSSGNMSQARCTANSCWWPAQSRQQTTRTSSSSDCQSLHSSC